MSTTNLSEFWTTKPADQIQYTTLEFRNATAGVRRFVAEQQTAIDFRLEADAPADPDTVVTFEPLALSAPEPEQGQDGELSLDIQMGAIGFQAKQYFINVFSAWPPTVNVVWRRHLEGVVYPVQVLYFDSLSGVIEDVSVALSCAQTNQAARDVSRVYKYDEFPGLKQT